MAARVPPHDDESEQALLGTMLLDARKVEPILAAIRESELYRPAHRRIYAAIAALKAQGHRVDGAAVRDQLERAGELAACGGREYVDALQDQLPFAGNLETPIRLVREHAQLRAIVDWADVAAEAAATRTAPPEEIRTRVLAGLLAMGADYHAQGFAKLALGDVIDQVERRSRGEGGGLRIGFPEFDEQTQGLQPGELFLLGAAPKHGKSTVAGQVGAHVALSGQCGVGLVSAEMDNASITERLLSAIAGVPIGAMRSGRLSDAHYVRLAAASSWLGSAPFWIDDSAVPHLDDVTTRVLELKARHPSLGLIVVDFLQLIQYRLKGRRGDEELEAIAYGLKALAKRANVVLLAPVQLNQKSIEDRADKRPLLRDISGSSGPLKAADFVALLHRPALYGELPMGTPDHLVVLVEAARRTPTFEFVLTWQATVMRGLPAGAWLSPDAPLPIPMLPSLHGSPNDTSHTRG